jgi:hypothetical protein
VRTVANSATHRAGPILLINADSGCTDNLLKKSAAHLLEDGKTWINYRVIVANNAVLNSIEKGNLRVPAKSGDIIIPAYVFDNNAISSNLAGLSTLCNKGCAAILNSETVEILKDGETVWCGTKGTTDRLWNLDIADLGHSLGPIPVSPPIPSSAGDQAPSASQSIHLDNDAEYVRFAHEVFASSPFSTFLHATRMGWLGNFPKLTVKMIQQNWNVSRATAMGYLDQTRQG